MIKKIFGTIAVILIIMICFINIQNQIIIHKYCRTLEEGSIDEEDKREVQEIYQIKSNLGKEIWFGFESADIPIILFNDKIEFLFSIKENYPSWEQIEKSEANTKLNIYKRYSKKPQAFAVKVDKEWTGSIGTYKKINKTYIEGVRNELPSILNMIIPYKLIILPRDFHVTFAIHEMFHAYQAISNEEKFISAEESHKELKAYPYDNQSFIDRWNKEGELLTKALNSTKREEIISYLKEFIKVRDERRKKSSLSQGMTGAEKRLEWLEGLAKYVEIRTYEIASEEKNNKLNYKYREGQPYWKQEFKRLEKSLGKIDGDFRFYLSGMAQARILDKLGYEWKETIMENDIYLEDIIREILSKEKA